MSEPRWRGSVGQLKPVTFYPPVAGGGVASAAPPPFCMCGGAKGRTIRAMSVRHQWIFPALGFLAAVSMAPALWPIDPQEDPGPGANRVEEPFAKKFSLRKAVRFADAAAQDWGKQYRCVTCHTNGLYLVARAGSSSSQAYGRTRGFARDYLKRYVVEKETPSGRRGAVEGIVATTCFLTLSDMGSRRRLGPITKRALDHMLSLQDPDGGWGGWLKCGWPPFESDDHFGVSLAAVAIGATPRSYRARRQAREGVQRLLGWLREHPPSNPHQKGMMLWAASSWPAVAEVGARDGWVEELKTLQKADGGWRLVDLGAGSWKRPEDDPDGLPSDAYATAFTVFVLCKAGVPAGDERMLRGLAWLQKHQRKSGRWFVRSPKRDGKHFISHAATMFAVMAFDACKKSR